MDENNRTEKKMRGSVITVIILAVCLCITTFALFYSVVAEEDNVFQTGTVEINLNDGRPVIEQHEFLFEPGMTVEKEFFLENESSCDVYYRLYFANLKGGLADVLDITISDGRQVIYSGKASQLTREQVGAADDILKINEREELTVSFHFPEGAGNNVQDLYLAFDLKADAVQVRNNPERLFD